MNMRFVFLMNAIMISAFFPAYSMEYGTDAYAHEEKDNSLSSRESVIEEPSSKRDSFKRRSISDSRMDRKKTLRDIVSSMFKKKETNSKDTAKTTQTNYGNPLVKTPSVPEMPELEKMKNMLTKEEFIEQEKTRKQLELEKKKKELLMKQQAMIQDICDSIKLNNYAKVSTLLYGFESIDINMQDSESGNTILMEAIINLLDWKKECNKAKDILDIILSKGISGDYNLESEIDLSLRNDEGKTALDIANESDDKYLAIRLQQLSFMPKKQL